MAKAAGLSELVPDDAPEPAPKPRCARCDMPVDLPPSEHFVTVCGGLACSPPVPSGILKVLPKAMKDR